jgi:hypothetical protein
MTFNTELWNGQAPVAGGYTIDRSIRLNSADSAYLNRTPASAGNRKTWTWAGWVKRSKISTSHDTEFFSAGTSGASNLDAIGFTTADTINFYSYGGSFVYYYNTSAVFRDTSAWYHVVAVVDTTNATSTDRVRLYINGVRVTAFASSTAPSQNADGAHINTTNAHYIGKFIDLSHYFDGYLADVFLIDGQALDPTSFGEFDDNGVWQPIAYTGSYGTNGFHLPFSDNSSAAALGKDTSDPNPINDGTVWSSITNGNFNTGASRGADKAFDGNVGGTVYAQANTGTTATVSNLGITGITSIRVNIAKNSGGDSWGTFALDSTDLTSWLQTNYPSQGNTGTWIDVTSQFTSSTLDSISITTQSNNTDDIRLAGVEINGVILRDGNSWTVNNIVASGTSTGFKAVTYTGNGSTQTISGLGFSPDLVWAKKRNGTTYHNLVDIVRGANKELYSNDTLAETTPATAGLTAFNSDGFDLGANSGWNANNDTYVAWCWDAGSSTVSNTDGSITSQVRANPNTGVSIVTYTGNLSASGSETVGHGLNAAPSMVITKSRDSTGADIGNWAIQHSSLTSTHILRFDTAASSAKSGLTAPTSTVFTTTYTVGLNVTGNDYVAYCFAPKTGISDFGSYTSTTNTSQKITVGFRPAFVLIKGNFSGSSWVMFDNSRGFSNHLLAESSNGENNPTGIGDLTVDDTGFTIPATGDNGNIRGGGTYIYAAFAEHVNPADIDSLLDSATNGDTANDTGLGGEVPGNYCTWNPLTKGTYTNGNLDSSNTTYQIGTGTIGVSSGKWYWEVAKTDSGTTHTMVGATPKAYSTAEYLGFTSGEGFGIYFYNGNLTYNGSGSGAYGAFSQGDILNVALDMDNGKVWFGKNGTWFNSGSPTAGTNALVTGLTGIHYPAVSNALSTVTCSANFGQRPFAYQAPSGFKALCTTNLPTPTIEDGSTAMDVALYTGNNTSQTISGLEFSPDLVWIKSRSTTATHGLFDVVRGALLKLRSNNTDAELSVAGSVTSFTSDGFAIGGDGGVNANNVPYVAWNWDAGSSTVSNTAGSITSSVRTSASSGFSIVTWTAPTTYPYTLGHGLSAKPELIIAKRRSIVSDWYVYHSSLGATKVLFLNKTDAQLTTSAPWNDTEPTSSVFTAGLSFDNSETMIAYCFAPVAGYSAFGSYTGNNSTDGPFVFTGFRPRYLLVKHSSSGSDPWIVRDTARDAYNSGTSAKLAPNYSQEENNSTYLGFASQSLVDFVSNGFKVRSTGNFTNASGETYIYAAFAENPFSIARAR